MNLRVNATINWQYKATKHADVYVKYKPESRQARCKLYKRSKNKETMAAHRDGPQSTIVTAPSFSIGCVFDKDLEALAMKHGHNTNRVAVPRSTAMNEMSWNVRHGDLVAYINPKFMKNNCAKGPPGAYKGRTPVVAQIAGIPFQFTDNQMVGMNEDEMADIKNQKLLNLLTFVGVAQSGYHNEQGGDNTPITNGFQVLIMGPSTVRLPMERPIPPMTDVVLSVDPSAGRTPYSRVQSLATAERTPLTIKEYNPRGPVHIARLGIAAYLSKYVQSSKNATGKFNPYKVQQAVNQGSAPYSEEDASAASFAVASMSVGMAMIDVLIRKGYLNYDSGAASGGATNANKWREDAPSTLGLANKTGSPEKHDVVEAILRSSLLGELPEKSGATNDVSFRTLTKSAMQLLASAVGDIHDQQYRIIGKNIQQHIGKDPRVPTGHVETDVIWR